MFLYKIGGSNLEEIKEKPFTSKLTTFAKILGVCQQIVNTICFAISVANKKRRHYDPNDYVIVENNHEAIISKDEFKVV